jgi:hypothetical protein
VKKAKSSIIYIKKMILIQRRARFSKKHILTKNKKDKNKTNKTRAKDKTGG